MQRLKEILTNAKQLELLDLGFMPDLIYVANKLDLFELLGRHSGASLRQLNLATIKERVLDHLPHFGSSSSSSSGSTITSRLSFLWLKENAAGSRPVLSINPDLFYPLKKLRQLGLDYDYVDDDLLHALGHERRDDSLLHLHLFVQRVDGAHRGPTNGSWARFVQAKSVDVLYILDGTRSLLRPSFRKACTRFMLPDLGFFVFYTLKRSRSQKI